MNRRTKTTRAGSRRSARLAALALVDQNDDDDATVREVSKCAENARRGDIGRFELVLVDDEDEEIPGEIIVSHPPVVVDAISEIEPIPLSKWRALRYDSNTSKKFMTFQSNVTGLVSELQKNEHNKCKATTRTRGKSLLLSSFERNAMDLSFVLPHNRLVNPLWEALGKALLEHTGVYNSFFVGFASIQLDVSVLKILSPALVAQPLTSLYFLGNNLSPGQLLIIADIIGQIPTLEAFAIARNMLGGLKEDVTTRLSTAIKSHPNLKRLVLASCGIGNSKTMLSCIRNKSLVNIDLASNGITTSGAISKFLAKAKNRCVKQLSLEDNKFNDKDALLFASALKLNKTLTLLNLTKNDISQKGLDVLKKSLFDESSLNAMADSNHKCRILVHKDDGSKGIDFIESINNPGVPTSGSFFGRKNKIVTMMFKTEKGCFDLRHYEDLRVELFPDVLSFIQYEKAGIPKAKVHTLLFELLRAHLCIFVARNFEQVVVSRKRKNSVL